eukprot:CAMPEP_0118706082 /NCGR_PEP_ID=MMETSP0800-20121206/20317_1 /TAXON_ID=210618 ORGANISM="Striatella unipunctata, Strain CCMP2910" /NCGR_SAMPLE_ID=MMETSP0800 /ASSEMBLY_ACC=CAM_ASM_000638 /LENGTH=48 /DNA_ID= /DNA_START= /DNA_END= /DNA_ORIENTATION=
MRYLQRSVPETVMVTAISSVVGEVSCQSTRLGNHALKKNIPMAQSKII